MSKLSLLAAGSLVVSNPEMSTDLSLHITAVPQMALSVGEDDARGVQIGIELSVSMGVGTTVDDITTGDPDGFAVGLEAVHPARISPATAMAMRRSA